VGERERASVKSVKEEEKCERGRKVRWRERHSECVCEREGAHVREGENEDVGEDEERHRDCGRG
jgi:hypothetical protein